MSVNQSSGHDQRPSIWRWVLGTLLIILVWQIAGTVLTIVAAVATGMTLEEFLPDAGFTIGELAPDRAALVLMAIMVSFIRSSLPICSRTDSS